MLNETPWPVMALDVAKVGIACQDIPVDKTVIVTVDSMPAMHAVGKLKPGIDPLQVRIVELVCRYQGAFVGCSRPGMCRRFLDAYVTPPLRTAVHYNIGRYYTRHFAASVTPANRTAEIHQAATLRIDDTASIRKGRHAASHCDICLELSHHGFRKAAPDEQAIHLRQCRVIDGIKPEDLRTRSGNRQFGAPISLGHQIVGMGLGLCASGAKVAKTGQDLVARDGRRHVLSATGGRDRRR